MGVGGGSVAIGIGLFVGSSVEVAKAMGCREIVGVCTGGSVAWVNTCPQAASVMASMRSYRVWYFACMWQKATP